MIKLYVASKLSYQAFWRHIRDAKHFGNVTFNSRWIDEENVTSENFDADYLHKAWLRNFEDIANSDILLCYAAPGDQLRGALIEAGAAISWAIPVMACGPGVENQRDSVFGSWQFHPYVTRIKDITLVPDALRARFKTEIDNV